MTILVAYATHGGSTAEIAEWIGAELRAEGLDPHIRPAAEVTDVSGYSAVVLGGSMYAAGWHTDARAFAQRFGAELAGRPVWLFSSGPLDHSADAGDLPPGPQIVAAMHAVHAQGHVTFGGKLTEEARGWLGFVARQMAGEGHTGDFRNPERIRAWARGIASDLKVLS
jgi:menaquinone-dependent protoporphyrinogen oxidase